MGQQRAFGGSLWAEQDNTIYPVCWVAHMRISARLAVHAIPCVNGVAAASDASASERKSIAAPPSDFFGKNVMLFELSTAGFVATVEDRYQRGSVVRLRVPGAGMLLARVLSMRAGRLRGEFVNPVSPARLRLALGMTDSTAGLRTAHA